MIPLTNEATNNSIELGTHEDDAASIVAARFRRSGYPNLSGIKCELSDGVLVLTGAVPTYHLKQLAQALALHTAGVQQIENCVKVTKSHAVASWKG